MSKVIEQNDKEGSKGYFSFGAYKVAGEGKSHKGYSYKTSTALLENIIAKREENLSLFSEMGEDKDIAITSSSHEYMDKKGKRVRLSPIKMKLTTALAQVADIVKEGVKERKYIKELPYMIEERAQNGKGITAKLPGAITCIVDVIETAKIMYSTNRVGGKQIDKVRQELRELSDIVQIYKFKDSRGGTLTIEAPLITLGKSIKYETKDGVTKFSKIEVTFEDVFVYEINERYSLSPLTLLDLWNEYGVQTELFTMLLFLLQSVRGNFIKHSRSIVANKRQALKEAKTDPQKIKKELEAIKREALTYKESIPSLLERLDTKKYQVGKYIHANKVKKDLLQAKESLIKMGIITDYYERTGTSGEIVCHFVINDRWILDESKKIKSLTYSPETPDEV